MPPQSTANYARPVWGRWRLPAVSRVLLVYNLVYLLFGIGDAVMSYAVPIFLEERLHSAFEMGLLISTSSMIGIVADLVIGGWFKGQKYYTFVRLAFLTAMVFPLILIFGPQSVPVYILAMLVWGIYYELVQFGDFHFVEEYTEPHEHAMAWGLLSMFRCLAYIIGPWLAGILLLSGIEQTFYFPILCYLAGFVVLQVLVTRTRKRVRKQPTVTVKPSLWREIRIWRIFIKRIWHLLLFAIALSLIDATFWTVGTLLSQDLHGVYAEGYILVLYGLPSLFVGLLAPVIAQPWGKKRAAFICGILAGVLLTLMGFAADETIMLLFVFLSSIFISLAWPELMAVFEDYVCRLGKTGNDMIGLQSAAFGVAYIVGPIVAGFIANMVGNQQTFSIVGILLAIVSALMLIIVPRKIRMPQSELAAQIDG